MRAHVGLILIFPIKSMDGVPIEEARITPGGILENDRVYSIVDAQDKFVNGKREARVHRLRCRFDAAFGEVSFSEQDTGRNIQCALAEPEPLNRWLSEYFGYAVTLKREPNRGFPDDLEAFGPTIVSRPSLSEVASWYPDLTVESARRRFRTNVELEGEDMPPFWEDRLYGDPGTLKAFQIGTVRFLGHNPCQRCAVPTRNPDTAETIPGFQKEFMERRRRMLPTWANAARFNHTYRFAVNTSIPPSEAGKRLRAGDAVEIPG
jgi:uncharacterized protein